MLSRVILLVLVSVAAVTGEDDQDDSTLKVGRSINVFDHYGYMSLSMRVLPESLTCLFKHDPRCFFCQQTADVFNNSESLKSRPIVNSRLGLNDFQMQFCDNPQELLQEYFRDFKFEKLQYSWRAYMGVIGQNLTAKYLGINRRYIFGDYCYVLMRYSRFQHGTKLSRFPNNATLDDIVEREMENVQVGDAQSVFNFVRKFGSHYINSFATGDSLYQTIVYDRRMCHDVKNRLKTQGLNISIAELTDLFSPWNVQQVGKIKVSSGNKTVESWASLNLRLQYHIFSYQNLLEIFANPPLLEVLNQLLQNEALLSIDMRTLGLLFQDISKRWWFDEMLDNRVKLWEVNL